MSIKVLTVIDKLNLGGIEKTYLSSIPYFQKYRYECHILCNKGGLLEEEFRQKSVRVLYFGNFNFPLLDAFLMLLLVIKNKYKIVHVRDGFTSGFFAMTCRLAGIPLIVSIHNSEPQFRLHWKQHWFLNKIRNFYLSFHKYLIYKYASKIIGHSLNNLNYYKNYISNDRKFTVVYNGIDFGLMAENEKNRDISKTKDHIRLVHVGSFKKQKNHISLIHILKKLIDNGHTVSLILCGEGKEKENIIALVDSLELSNFVEFKGNIKEPAKELLQSDIFVFPSLYEGFGNALIEAQYNFVAICASDIPPHYESVSNIYHKYFFPSDDIELASKNIEELIELVKTNKITPYLEEAKRFADSFTIENMVDHLNKIYQEVLIK